MMDNDERVAQGTLRELTAVWWILLLTGLLSLIAGIVVLLEPHHSLVTLAVVAGIFVLVDSVIEVAHAFIARSAASTALFAVVGVVIGLLLIRYPIHSVAAVALLIGLWLVAIGVLRLVASISGSRDSWSLLIAALEIIAGVVIVASPGIGVATLAVLVGVSFILNGIAMIVYAGALRSFGKDVRRAGADQAGTDQTGADRQANAHRPNMGRA